MSFPKSLCIIPTLFISLPHPHFLVLNYLKWHVFIINTVLFLCSIWENCSFPLWVKLKKVENFSYQWASHMVGSEQNCALKETRDPAIVAILSGTQSRHNWMENVSSLVTPDTNVGQYLSACIAWNHINQVGKMRIFQTRKKKCPTCVRV